MCLSLSLSLSLARDIYEGEIVAGLAGIRPKKTSPVRWKSDHSSSRLQLEIAYDALAVRPVG
jgi:hypothetical protein